MAKTRSGELLPTRPGADLGSARVSRPRRSARPIGLLALSCSNSFNGVCGPEADFDGMRPPVWHSGGVRRPAPNTCRYSDGARKPAPSAAIRRAR